MPAGSRLILDNAVYHIITRGNQEQKVFMGDVDYNTYLSLLRVYKKRHKLKLYSWCLMPNHVHFVAQLARKEDLCKFMAGLNRAYTAYFNIKYGKVGHLWQGRFKSKILYKDRYLLDCINYIELNPVRANMIEGAFDYKYSSYKERNMGIGKKAGLLDELSI